MHKEMKILLLYSNYVSQILPPHAPSLTILLLHSKYHCNGMVAHFNITSVNNFNDVLHPAIKDLSLLDTEFINH